MCKHCKSDFAYNAHKNGTNTYRHHLQICKLVPRNGDISQMMVNAVAKFQARKIDQSVFRELVAKTIIQHDLPFSYVEYERVRETWKYLNADVKFFSRNTAAADIYKFYEIETDKLKRELAQLPGRISLITDLWSALTHEGMNLAMKILGKLKDWGIEKKVFSITVDNAGNNDTMQEIVKSQLVLRDDLLCKGEFFHVRCATHILNIIVQIGLKGIGDTLEKIRESIKYVKGSEHREILFAKCMENVGINLKAGLLLDVANRWNSTFKMLDRALKYRAAFGNLKVIDAKNYKFHPTDAEWHRLQQMSDFLESFDQITNLISVNESSQDEVIRNMIVLMKERFDKYWAEVSNIFAIATVFDPRLKLTLVDYCFAKLDISTREKGMKHLRAQLRKLFEVYENKSNADFFAFRKANVVANGKSTLDMYLDEPAMNVKGFEIASESSFSIGTRVLSKYRNRLLPRNVQALICSRNWLKGFESYENEEYEKFDAEDETLPSFQSLVDDADGC
ncbi:unnamed protein product [Arabidopsis thaliana]|uniref:(thale cress) hypothetical protein n=1 Tax=Arabidopsis thaliana TaxID=3702 RepID=A0A7G2F158_ARATH|nr:unnamed protein product [Arabidopsis thaliana]